jgi:hypothetical protein
VSRRAAAALAAVVGAAAVGAVPTAALAQAAPAGATSTGATSTGAADSAAVLAVVRGLFDAMRAGDSARVRASFDPAAALGTTRERDGRPVFERDSVGAFVRAVGTPHADVWDERLYRPEVRVDGPLATVWTEYAFYAGPRFSHCGVDAIQLARTAAGWRIVSLVDTRRRTGCTQEGAPAR